jgi:Fe-S oxidoreductase
MKGKIVETALGLGIIYNNDSVFCGKAKIHLINEDHTPKMAENNSKIQKKLLSNKFKIIGYVD